MRFNKKGQTLTEFILVFAVLLLASAGVWTLYKSYWKARFDKANAVSVSGQISERTGYVK